MNTYTDSEMIVSDRFLCLFLSFTRTIFIVAKFFKHGLCMILLNCEFLFISVVLNSLRLQNPTKYSCDPLVLIYGLFLLKCYLFEMVNFSFIRIYIFLFYGYYVFSVFFYSFWVSIYLFLMKTYICENFFIHFNVENICLNIIHFNKKCSIYEFNTHY